jgi:glutaredoxin
MENTSYLDLLKINDNGILIISKENCLLCDKLKQLFDTIEVLYNVYKYEEIDIEIKNDYPFKTEMKHKTGGKLFPFCYFNGIYVGGYKEVYNNLMTGKLKDQLNNIGLDYEEDF